MMKSNFLNLPSSASGDARRHVPFRSIINKHFSILFVLVFVFSLMFSYCTPSYALAAPELNPVYNTDIVQIEEYVNGLSSGQMDVFNLLLGFYLASQAGAAKYQLEDPYEDQSGVLNWLKSCGVKFYNDFGGWLGGYDPIYGIDKDKFLAILMGAAVLADQYSNETDFVSDIENSNNYFLPFNQSLQIGLNQFFASYGGLYDWQFDSDMLSPLNLSNGLTYSQISLYPETQVTYISYIDQLQFPRVRFNKPGSVDYNCVAGGDLFSTYRNLFADTHYHVLYLCDDLGNIAPESNRVIQVYVNQGNGRQFVNTSGIYISTKSVNISGYSNIKNLYNDLCNNVISVFTQDVWLSDFISGLYYGDSWANKQVWTSDSDLNFGEASSVSYDQVQTDLLIDIKGLLQDLIDVNELREPVFDNLYNPDGQPVSDPATVNVSVNAILPESGIDIPNNLFDPLTREGGYISYLWYMTKPLVQYTSDFVQTMVFDGNEDFDMTGPGAIVFGVISLGLIGGLVVKCLL